jgi:hypothetical protein
VSFLETRLQSDFAGSLRVVDQASEIDSSKALDLSNVRVGQAGEIRRRGGSVALSTFDEVADYQALTYTEAGSGVHLLGGTPTRLRAMTVAGASVDVETVSGQVFSFAAFGAPTTERVYCVNDNDCAYWDGAAFTLNPTVTADGVGAQQFPRGQCCAVTPWDNRLMVAGFAAAADGLAGANGSASTMFFSEQGDPTTWKAVYRETVQPGDGEKLVAAVSWLDRTFVFKQTKFFVVFGTSDNGRGSPVFEWYAVQANVGVQNPQAVCAHRTGVYFIDRKGVYVTQGEEPVCVSDDLEALFRGLDTPFYTGLALDLTRMAEATITSSGELIYCFLPTQGGSFQTFVFDPRIGWWGYDTLAGQCGVGVPVGGREDLAFAKDGAVRVFRQAEGVAQDVGSAIASHWQGAWQSFESFDEKELRRLHPWGVGTIALSCAVDLGAPSGGGQIAFDADSQTWGDGTNPADTWGDGSGTDTWGGGGGFGDGWVNWNWRGRLHSIRIAGVNGSDWSVQRLEHHVGVPKAASTDREG